MKHVAITFALVGAALLSPLAFAQSSTRTPYQQSDYYAIDYGQWGIKSQTANTYLFSPSGLCVATASGRQFFPFATNAPVLILDATPANSEIVTPASAINTGSQCGFTGSPVNNHFSFQVQSGTAGLQEAINVLGPASSSYPARINLDRNWFVTANSLPNTSGNTILNAVKGSARALVIDLTTHGITGYVWNGTAYTAGTWVNTAPAAAVGAAAGTGATITETLSSTALSQAVTLTSGTATTTGTLFTLTWATTAQFFYAPTGCTVASSGPNSFTSFTSATSYTASHAVLTVTATAAPNASTPYKFVVNGCQ